MTDPDDMLRACSHLYDDFGFYPIVTALWLDEMTPEVV
jgi:hypothetical protein